MSKTMKYKGYEGSVLYSAEDRLLHGKLQGIRDFVLYDGVDLPILETNFKGAVDEYLEFCRVEGKIPDTPAKRSSNIRISDDLHRQAARFAEEHNRKLNTVVRDALQEYLTRSA